MKLKTPEQIEAERQYKRAYYLANKDKYKRWKKESEARHPDKKAAIKKREYQKNKAQYQESSKKYREENKEQVSAARRRHYEENKDWYANDNRVRNAKRKYGPFWELRLKTLDAKKLFKEGEK